MGHHSDRLDPFVSQTPIKPCATANATPRTHPPNTLDRIYSTYRHTRRASDTEAQMPRESIGELSAKKFAE